MKVLLLVGLLALVEASGRYDSQLQRFAERETGPELDEPIQEKSDDKKKRDADRDGFINKIQQYLQNEEREDNTEEESGGAETAPPVPPDDLENEQDQSSENESNERIGEEAVNRDSGSVNNQQTQDKTSMRDLLQKIKSRMDEIKREQSQMKLSDPLTRVLTEKRRKLTKMGESTGVMQLP